MSHLNIFLQRHGLHFSGARHLQQQFVPPNEYHCIFTHEALQLRPPVMHIAHTAQEAVEAVAAQVLQRLKRAYRSPPPPKRSLSLAGGRVKVGFDIECWRAINAATSVGFDTEWDSYITGGPLTLLQLCCANACLLLPLGAEEPSSATGATLPLQARALLENPAVRKYGISLHQDLRKLDEQYGVKVRNVCDVAEFHSKRFGFAPNAGTERLAARFLHRRLKKAAGLARSFTFDTMRHGALTSAQQRYAALDALVALRLGVRLDQLVTEGGWEKFAVRWVEPLVRLLGPMVPITQALSHKKN